MCYCGTYIQIKISVFNIIIAFQFHLLKNYFGWKYNFMGGKKCINSFFCLFFLFSRPMWLQIEVLSSQTHIQVLLPPGPQPQGSGFGGKPHRIPVAFTRCFLTGCSQSFTCAIFFPPVTFFQCFFHFSWSFAFICNWEETDTEIRFLAVADVYIGIIYRGLYRQL